MTEAEWLGVDDPRAMLMSLLTNRRASERKLRLFACSCCRHVWHYLSSDLREAVGIAERVEDGLATKDELEAAWERVYSLAYAPADASGNATETEAARMACYASAPIPLRSGIIRLGWDAAVCAVRVATSDSVRGFGGLLDEPALATLLRDVVDPFHEIRLDPAWLMWNGGTVVGLAQSIYEERPLPKGTLDNGRLGVLADALEEAGCDNADILAHCRGPGLHVRGCWVVDLLLGKN